MKLTKKQTNWLIFGFIGALFLAAIIFLIYRLRSSRPQVSSGNISAGGNTPSTFTDAIDRDLKLKKGDRGNNVMELQKKLNEKGAGLVIDGIFGRDTLAAMKSQVQYPTLYESNGISWHELDSEQAKSGPTGSGTVLNLQGSSWITPDTTGVGNYGTSGIYDPMGYYNSSW